MTEIQLKPITVKQAWSFELAAMIKKLVYDAMFADLLKAFEQPAENAKKTVVEGYIEKGQMHYTGSLFKGKVSLAISKEMREIGAKWNAKHKAWEIPFSQLPEYLKEAIRKDAKRSEQIIKQIKEQIEFIPSRIQQQLAGMDLKKPTDKLYQKIKRDFKGTVLDRISLLPDLTKEQRIFLDETYVESLVLPIRDNTVADVRAGIAKAVTDFASDEIIALRKRIQEHVQNGLPRKDLEKTIDDSLNKGMNRARFIARQETSLFTTAFKTAHYTASGIKKYKWRTVGDGAVRERHEELNGRIFAYNNPPIVDQPTGRRGNPGQDYNCRCVDSPIIDF